MSGENLFNIDNVKKENEINQKNVSFNDFYKEMNPNFKEKDGPSQNNFQMLMDNCKNLKRKQSRPTIITDKKSFAGEEEVPGYPTNIYEDDEPQKKDRTPKEKLVIFSNLEKNKRFLANKVLMVRL